MKLGFFTFFFLVVKDRKQALVLKYERVLLGGQPGIWKPERGSSRGCCGWEARIYSSGSVGGQPDFQGGA